MDQKLKQDISIGTRIRELRIERHMTQEQVATKLQLLNLDITRSVYSQIENGTYNIRISILAGLAQIFQGECETFSVNNVLEGLLW
ncbi:helix-turn-helix domain-containing protein [[Ruminococcus] torques]|uniref:helix-turn-helix domain-containing protein n=1 Tax=[Ruminococcus] torques TaxID=33039 RepID=UPI0027B9510E|nr:helix-turn-helix transcriptional regulator [[Ruminococcus] torques]